MRSRIMTAAGLFLTGCILSGAVPKQAGVCFRFDDNKSEKEWREMAKVFEENNARFGMSICSSLMWWPKGYSKLLADLQKRGFEIMDHTPEHSLFSFIAENDKELSEIRKMPSFDHASGKKVYFKYTRNAAYPGGFLTGDVKGKTVSGFKADSRAAKLLKVPNFLYDPASKTAWRFIPKADRLELRSLWNENNVNLPEVKNFKFEVVCGMGGFDVPADVLKLQVETARKRFKARGIVPPVTYIQPGGTEPVPDAANIASVYSKYGYTGGATYPRSAYRAFCEPNPSRARFAMMWGQFNLEGKNVSSVKTNIAESIARNQVVIASSHMNVRSVPGGWAEFLKRHDELLKWCRAKNIPVRLQKDWCRILYDEKADPECNIFPSLSKDLDGNGIPDAWKIHKPSSVKSGILTIVKTGKVFDIVGLCGAERGNNVFSFRYSSEKDVSFTVFITANKGSWNEIGRKTFQINLSPEKKGVFSGDFNVPEGTDTLRIDFRCGKISAPVELADFSIKSKKKEEK